MRHRRAQGAVWVGVYGTGTLLRLDPDTGRVTRRIPIGSWACRVAVDTRAAWVTRDRAGELVRVDLGTGRRQRLDVGALPFDVTLAFGAIWVTGFDAGTVTRKRRMRRVDVGTKAPGWPRCIRGELWVTTPNGVLRIDPRSGEVLARLRLEGTPAEAAAGPDGLVWVTDKERSLVHRIYAKRGVVVNSFAAGPGAYSLARVDRAMWITSFAGADIRRYDRR